MKDIAAPQKQVPLNHTKKLGNVEFSGYLKSQPETVNLTFSIQKYLENHPNFYYNSLLSQLKGRPFQQVKASLQKQYKALLEGKSFYHRISNGIQARKKCLNKIKRDITRSSKFMTMFPQEYFGDTAEDAAFVDWVQIEGYTVVDVDESVEESIRAISNIFVDMSRLREMTIYLVQEIHQWRVRIQEHLDRCQQHTSIYFFYEDENVYQTFLQDTCFIWTSKLSHYIWLEIKQDPFIIRNVIMVEQRQIKSILEKYFIEIVYPKNEDIIDQAVKCFEMLAFKYEPKIYNRFQEEELLIENYLKMEMNQHQFDQPQEGHRIRKLSNDSPKGQTPKSKEHSPKEGDLQSSRKKNRLNPRGWVFEQPLKKPNRERINQIIQSHKSKMSMIKPFNIANYAEKSSIALAYFSEVKQNNQLEKRQRRRRPSVGSAKEVRNIMSEGQEQGKKKKRTTIHQRGLQSEPQRIEKRVMSESKMFKSVTKLSSVIYQDPKQELPDTPKNKNQTASRIPKAFQYESDGNVSYGKTASLKHIKFNTFFNQKPKEQPESTKIQVEQEQTPLNLNMFYEVFRADTNKPSKMRQTLQVKRKTEPIKALQGAKKGSKEKNEKYLKIKEFLQKVKNQRYERVKSMQVLPYTRKPVRISLAKKKKQKSKSIQKSLDKSADSYKDYTKIKPEAKLELPKDTKQIKKMFLALKAKSIPIDLVASYVKYLESIRPQKSRIFSQFDTKVLGRKLSDPFVHSVIFDIETENHASVGTVVLSEALGGRGGRLKYLVQFMSIHPFELVSVAMLRVAQELLSATPCQEVVYPLIVDRLDIVSSHFIEIIDQDLMEGVQKFGRLTIMERSRPSLKGTDVRQRMYSFTAHSNAENQYGLKLKMMGNYRSLKFQCKCLVLTSNFRLRSQNLFKNTQSKYQKVAIGELYARAFMQIMTKYHMKQLKQASYGGQGELGEVVRNDPFLRSVLYASAYDMKESGQVEGLLKSTVFGNMDDLLNYLRYKNHEEYFHFQFLAQSRFILHHELILIQLDQEISLEFTMTSTQSLYMLHNHKNLRLIELASQICDVSAFLLPTTSDKIDMFIMPASHYLSTTTDNIDLYSYLSLFFRNALPQVHLNQIPSIVIPNLHNQGRRISKVRMFDGFFKLFPQRQFYSAAAVNCINHWQSYYPDAVVHQPLKQSIIVEYPFILGFYDKNRKILLSAFMYSDPLEGQAGPS